MIYLDTAATMPIRSKAKQAMLEAMDTAWGNTSSVHTLGRIAATKLAEVREDFADLIGAKPTEVYFTSGGSESNAIIHEQLLLPRGTAPHWVHSSLEHASITAFGSLFAAMGIGESVVKPNTQGYLEPQSFVDALTADTKLASFIGVHNVLGTVQPWEALASAVKDASKQDIWVHADTVQTLGKAELSLKDTHLDSASFGGHKVGGPKGIGALWSRKAPQVLSPAGGQEFGVRGGTTPLPLIVGFVCAAREAVEELRASVQERAQMRELMYRELSKIDGIRILSPEHEETSILCLVTNSLPSEVAVRVLADQEIYVSPGASACHSNKKSKKDLSAMGVVVSAKEAETQLRLSWKHLSLADAETCLEAFRALQRRYYK